MVIESKKGPGQNAGAFSVSGVCTEVQTYCICFEYFRTYRYGEGVPGEQLTELLLPGPEPLYDALEARARLLS